MVFAIFFITNGKIAAHLDIGNPLLHLFALPEFDGRLNKNLSSLHTVLFIA